MNFSESWLFDTAATHYYFNYKKVNEQVYIAVGMSFPMSVKGNVKMVLNNHEYIFKAVLYSPKLQRNLISGTTLLKEGAKFNCKEEKLKVIGKDGSFIFFFSYFEKWCLSYVS